MSQNDSLFLYKEEDGTVAIAQAICKALGLRTADSLDWMLMDVELELDYRQAEARNIARGYKALKALLPPKPGRKQARSRAEQAYDDMAVIMDLISEVGVQMTTSDIVDCCASTLDIPQGRVRFALEILELDGKIAFGADGWVIQDKDTAAETVG